MTLALHAPASKSVSHRALIAAALAKGQSTVSNLLECEDTQRTADVLSLAGASICRDARNGVRVLGMPTPPRTEGNRPLEFYLQESGSSFRILAPVFAAGHGSFRFFGERRLHERPARELCSALESLGSRMDFEGQAGHAPFVLHADGLTCGGLKANERGVKELPVSMEESSQHLSGLLFAATLAPTPLCFAVTGKKAVSWPYVRLTLDMLERFGARAIAETRDAEDGPWRETAWRAIEEAHPGRLRLTVFPRPLTPRNIAVEGDWSAASYLLAAGALGSGPVLVEGLSESSCQGDAAISAILKQMGARLEFPGHGVIARPSALHGIDIDMGHCPDLVPTVAALAAFAQGNSRIFNIGHLRAKECDRISACASMLEAIGVDVEEKAEEIAIRGLGPKGLAEFEGRPLRSFGDHRMVMAQSLFFLRSPHVRPSQAKAFFDAPQAVAKSFPRFWEEWAKLDGLAR